MLKTPQNTLPLLKHCSYYEYFHLFIVNRSPIVVGGSVVGLFYKNGVLLASDTGACYGSIKMFKSCPRIESINQNVLICFIFF